MKNKVVFVCAAAASLSLAAAQPSHALVIVPTYDVSITGHPSAGTIMGSINSLLTIYQNTFSDPITVNITFKADESIGLGQSVSFLSNSIPYNAYRAALVADASSADDATALASLPGGAANPVTGGPNIAVKTANLRAIGINAAVASDGTISLKTSLMNLDRVTIDPGKYDLMAVAMHEVNEVLGFGSGINSAFNPFPQDLFRYDAAGNRTYTTAGDDAFLSIDGGVTKLARFNQNGGGDYGDFWSLGGHTPQVQDAFATPGATPDLGVELRNLDVIGYDRIGAAAPEPGTLALVALGGVVLAARRRRNR